MARTDLILLTLFLGLTACQDHAAQPKAEPMKAEAIAPGSLASSDELAVQKDGQAGVEAGQEEANAPLAQDPAPPASPHTAWDALLRAHVDPDTHQVDYAALKQKEAELDGYLASLASADPQAMSTQERFAFYINAYNASTVKLILEKYPKLKSIRDYKDPWKQVRWVVGQETLSLDQIEHEKLRPVFKDPRIHFAVNCAAVGCPPLRAEAYRAGELDAQLEAATTATLTSPRYVKTKGDVLYLSAIFDWYGKDFIDPEFKGSKPTVAAYVKEYALPDTKEVIESKQDAPKVRFLEYDWSLNQKKK